MKLNKYVSKRFRPILVLIFLFSFATKTICQVTRTDTIEDPLKKFVGDWVLKNELWKSSENGNYTETELNNFAFKAELIGPDNTLLWHEDFGNGFLATILWSYQKESKIIHHLSNNGFNNIGIGVEKFDDRNDIRVETEYTNLCTNCYYEYYYHWISLDEIEFKATFYEDDNPNGDFYGGNFVRKLE